MASTTSTPRNQAPAVSRPAAPALVPGGARQRRWSLALLAVLVTLGSALAFVVLWMNAGGRQPVLALSNDVAAGQVIEDGDLTVVRVSADQGVTLVGSGARDDVVGKPAATDLLDGTLLVPEAVGTADGLDRGTAVIGIPVPRIQVPVDDLETGDQVVLARTVGATSGGAAAADTIGTGRVFSVQDDGEGSDIRVSVAVDESLALAIAAAVHEDEIYMWKIAAG